MKKLAEENKNKEELLKYQKRMQGGKRRDRRKAIDTNEQSWLSTNLMKLGGVSVLIISVIVGFYYAIYSWTLWSDMLVDCDMFVSTIASPWIFGLSCMLILMSYKLQYLFINKWKTFPSFANNREYKFETL